MKKKPNTPRRRALRLAEILRKELSVLLGKCLRDPRLQPPWLTVTEVNVSPDLKNAYVYFSSLDEQSDPAVLQQTLQGATSFFRTMLSRRLEGGYGVPQLKFLHDTLITGGMKMDRLIDEANAHRLPE